MLGEQFDLLRSYINNYENFYTLGYKNPNSIPDNLLPIIGNTLGFDLKNPLSGSLENYLQSTRGDEVGDRQAISSLWTKILNNIIYVYKTKGTMESLNTLLNLYGYDTNNFELTEFGGSFDDHNPSVVTNDSPKELDNGLNNVKGNVSFREKTEQMKSLNLSTNTNLLQLDWWSNDAEPNGVEFIFRTTNTPNTQTLARSSGSASNKHNWDLRIIPSGSSNSAGKLEFRLNDTAGAGSVISNNAISMSTDFIQNVNDFRFYNVLLQRQFVTSSYEATSALTQSYHLFVGRQEDDKIKDIQHISMSSLSSNANQNYITASGQTSNNLVFGDHITGSIAEIRAWDSYISMSKFKQHILNKFSTVGNVLRSHCDELVYQFKLNENYSLTSISSSTQNLQIVDSSGLTHHSNYSFDVSGSLFSGSTAGIVYGFDIIDVIQLGLQDNNQGNENDNTILINPNNSIVGNLNPNQSNVKFSTNSVGKKSRFKTSNKLELYRSPQTFINNFILDRLSGFNLETLYGNPLNYYSQSYGELDTFRNEFFDCYTISSDVNEFIRAHENMFNDSITEGLKSIVPARSTFSDKNSNMGVEIKPTVLEKQKYENEEHSVEVNPNTATGSIKFIENNEYKQTSLTSTFESLKTGSISINITNTSTYEQPKSASISVNVINTTTYELPKSGSISPSPSLNESSVPTSKDGTYDYASIANKSYSDLNGSWGIGANDTHFINFAGGLNSRGDFNTYHIESRFIFNSIGDNEYYSASIDNSSNFTDSKRFYNRKFVTGTANGVSSDVQYEDKNFGTGLVTGRMMGKTRYFTTGSDGNITLPSNHVNKFSNPFKDRMYLGAQNIKPGKLNVRYEDYSVDSFYKVTVTGGENNIRINSGNPSKGDDDKIIYDTGGG